MNAVLRREHRLGSTLFLVGHHARDEFVHDQAPRSSQQLRELFSIPGESVLLLKVSHRIGR